MIGSYSLTAYKAERAEQNRPTVNERRLQEGSLSDMLIRIGVTTATLVYYFFRKPAGREPGAGRALGARFLSRTRSDGERSFRILQNLRVGDRELELECTSIYVGGGIDRRSDRREELIAIRYCADTDRWRAGRCLLANFRTSALHKEPNIIAQFLL